MEQSTKSLLKVGPCAKQTVRATIVARDGQRIVGTNWCSNAQPECPRKGLATGEGYHLCKGICGQVNHAEVDACIKAGPAAVDSTLYLEGHTYCCDPCLQVMKEYGVNQVIFGPPPEES